MTEHVKSTRRSEAGVTLIEMMIAIVVLSIALLGLAQLFVVATMNSSLANNTAQGMADAQIFIEKVRSYAAKQITDGHISSGTFDEGSQEAPAYTTAFTGDSETDIADYQPEAFKASVWIFDDTGTLINPAGNTVDPGLPDGYDSAPVAPSASSRIVVMQLVPKVPDPRFNQTITLSTVINANRISS